jgi:hypothetical protein
VTATIEDRHVEVGVDHDVTHPDAGVEPERANLTSRDTFVANERTRLRDG